jgi:class 3 adenylate cyclase
MQPGLDYGAVRRIVLTNQIAVMAVGIALVHAVHIAIYDWQGLWHYGVLSLAGVVTLSLGLLANARGQHRLAKSTIALMPPMVLLGATAIGGNPAGLQLYLIALWTALFLMFSRKDAWLMGWFTVIYIGSYLVSYFLLTKPIAALPPPPDFLQQTALIAAVDTFLFIGVVIYLFHDEVHMTELEMTRKTVQAEREQLKSERLLRNMLPPSIAMQLKDEYKTIAERYPEATVLFADIVGFAAYSAKHTPDEVVQLLDAIFLRFDWIVENLGLEKIKTVGDAYLLVGGVPQARPDHAQAVGRAALAMRDAVAVLRKELQQDLHVRIGIHSGPVVAGVVGANRLSYDVWGATVNIASRMESHGEADHIHVSDTTHRLLEPYFLFESRGTIEVKGGGVMRTWFLLGPRAAAAPNAPGPQAMQG